MIPSCRHQALTIATQHPNDRLPWRVRSENRPAPEGGRSPRDVTCKSLSPVCNGDGCFARPAHGAHPDPRIRRRPGHALAGRPIRVWRHQVNRNGSSADGRSQARAFSAPGQRLASVQTRRALSFRQVRCRSGQMSGHTTPHSSSVNRQYLRDCVGLLPRPDFPSRLSVSIEPITLLQHAGLCRPMRGAPARGSGLSSAARRVSLAAAPMEDSYGQQDAYRCHPSGGDPGRGGARIAYRGI